MTLRSLLWVTPWQFAISSLLIMMALAGFIAVLPDGPISDVVGVLVGLLAFYGYPSWIVLASGLPVSSRATVVFKCCLIYISGLFLLALFLEPDTLNNEAWWKLPLGAATGIAILTPLVLAAATLRSAELARGRDIPAGGLSAFFWLCYMFIGWVPMHRRVRVASGIDDMKATMVSNAT